MEKSSESIQPQIDAAQLHRSTREIPSVKRSCYDCKHLSSAISWWCMNAEAIKARGTAIPGCIHCPYWSPDWRYIDKKYKPKSKTWFHKLFNIN